MPRYVYLTQSELEALVFALKMFIRTTEEKFPGDPEVFVRELLSKVLGHVEHKGLRESTEVWLRS